MMRLCLSVLLSLVLAGTVTTARVAHAAPMPGHTKMVICSDDGAETITLDAAGNRVAPADCARHGCPDCLQPVAVSVALDLLQAKPAAARREALLGQPEHPPAWPVATATARSPPSED